MKKNLLALFILITITAFITTGTVYSQTNENRPNKRVSTIIDSKDSFKDPNQLKGKFYCGLSLSYSHSSVIDKNEFGKVIGKPVKKTINTYKDTDGNSFIFDNDGRLIAYKSNMKTSSKTLSKEEAFENATEQLSKLVNNLSDFKLIDFVDSEIGYHAYFESNPSTTIKVSILPSGCISSIVINYFNNSNVSEDDILYLKDQLDKYISANYQYSSYTYEVSYEIIEGSQLANYTVLFTDNNGAYFADVITISR